MLYTAAQKRLDWGGLPFVGGWTGAQTAQRPQPVLPRRSIPVHRHEATSSFLADQGEKLFQLQETYGLRLEPPVGRFLHAHPTLVDLLLEAYAYLEQYFGLNPQVGLEVVSDPDSDDSEELFANIRTSLSVDEALERLDRLDQGWFLAQLGRTGGRFNFNLEFV